MEERTFNRLMVTGATGFLGHHLVEQLIADGRSVVALVRDPESEGARRVAALGAKLEQGDALDGERVEAVIRGEQCEAVLHCAGRVLRSRKGRDVIDMNRINVAGVETVLDAAKRGGARRAVVVSTSGTIAISEDPDHVADETADPPLDLINKWPYYRSKYYGEEAALKRNAEDFEVVVVNPSIMLGPGDQNGSSTEDVRRALDWRMPVVPAGGYSFVDVRDVAVGMRLALDAGRPGQRYLLISCNCPIRTFISRINRVADIEGPVFALPDASTVKRVTKWFVRQTHELLGEDATLPDEVSIEMAQHYWYADSTLAENELGWRARDPMDTLADTVNDLRARGVVAMRVPA